MKTKKITATLIILTLLLNISISNSISVTSETSKISEISGIQKAPEISAQSSILMDSTTEKILYSKNETQKMYPASTTKILTAILTIENTNPNDIVTIQNEAISTIPSGYSIAPLQVGEQFTIQQLLEVMLIYSANDAANVLAYHISGSIENFAKLMNSKIVELGLKNTHFTNPSGMHDNNHYTTANDLAIIMKYCMKNNTFRQLSLLKNCTLPLTDKYEQRNFQTTNELLEPTSQYYYKYAIAGKTGYTSQSQNCLVSVSNKDGLELICVVLSVGISPNNLSTKFIETKNIFDYGYNNYTISKICERNSIETQIEIINGTKETKKLDLLISDDIYALTSQIELKEKISSEIKLEKNLFAPISQGQKIGKIIYNINGSEYTSDLIASHSVEKSNTITFIIQILLIILILFLLYKFLFEYKFKKFHKF